MLRLRRQTTVNATVTEVLPTSNNENLHRLGQSNFFMGQIGRSRNLSRLELRTTRPQKRSASLDEVQLESTFHTRRRKSYTGGRSDEYAKLRAAGTGPTPLLPRTLRYIRAHTQFKLFLSKNRSLVRKRGLICETTPMTVAVVALLWEKTKWQWCKKSTTVSSRAMGMPSLGLRWRGSHEMRCCRRPSCWSTSRRYSKRATKIWAAPSALEGDWERRERERRKVWDTYRVEQCTVGTDAVNPRTHEFAEDVEVLEA